MDTVNILENGQQIGVSLVSYFTKNGKNYVFYTKNETTDDSYTIMYAAIENNGANEAITPEEFDVLKTDVMGGSIKGNAIVDGFITYGSPINVGEAKAIKVPSAQLGAINSYYLSNQQTPETNKDLLNQNFATQEFDAPQTEEVPATEENVQEGTPIEQAEINNINNNEVITPQVEEAPVNDNQVNTFDMPQAEVNANPGLNVTAVPDLSGNTFDMEGTPANLNTEDVNVAPELVDSVVPFDPNQSLESISTETPNETLTINNVTPGPEVANTPENSFDLNSGTNLFDVQSPEVNEPIDNNVPSSNDYEDTNKNLKLIGFNNVKIDIYNQFSELYNRLTEITKKENELLGEKKTNDLENTAANLFQNNGTLDNTKILGQ